MTSILCIGRVVTGKGYIREPYSNWLILFICVKCKMVDFGAVKCDLYYAREPCVSIRMLSEMRIIDVNSDS